MKNRYSFVLFFIYDITKEDGDDTYQAGSY